MRGDRPPGALRGIDLDRLLLVDVGAGQDQARGGVRERDQVLGRDVAAEGMAVERPVAQFELLDQALDGGRLGGQGPFARGRATAAREVDQDHPVAGVGQPRNAW